VKVAILDSGFRGYREQLGKVLPRNVRVKSFRTDGDLEARPSQHGILCAEVVHAIAPEAELLLANWEPNDPGAFLDAVRWAKSEGARVITCSLIMPSWSDGEGGGAVHQALSRIIGGGKGKDDVLFFAAAGNTALRHWSGTLRPDRDGRHQWADGVTVNRITPWGDERVAVELYGRDVAGVAVEVTDAEKGAKVEQVVAHVPGQDAEDSSCLVVRFVPEPARRYHLRLRLKKPGPAPKNRFHLVVLGGELAHSRHQGSIAFPADSPAALALGAVDEKNERCCFSSCGPNSPLPKPDFVAPVPFPSRMRQRPFTGTSAAAPQAAGMAALVWSKHTGWTADRVKGELRRSALDLGPAGHDCETGYGLIRLR
jgi:subtilisin family serine protease